jgi:hypothetical protein
MKYKGLIPISYEAVKELLDIPPEVNIDSINVDFKTEVVYVVVSSSGENELTSLIDEHGHIKIAFEVFLSDVI